jgi:hypothetical protein
MPRRKTEKVIEIKDGTSEDRFDDRLDVYQFLSDIKLRINKDITSDFVLARLEQQDKEGIIEMTANAYFTKKLLYMMAEKGTYWHNGKKEKLDPKQKTYIQNLGKAIFDSFLTRIYMTVVLNRNVDKNYLVNVLSGYKEDAEEEIDLSSLKGQLQQAMSGRGSETNEK